MAKSLAQIIAAMSDEERIEVLAGLDPDALQWDWSFWGRPEQQRPVGDDWNIWMYLAGRGAGKTRTAAEWVREEAKYTTTGQRRFALVSIAGDDDRPVIPRGLPCPA